MTAEAHRPPVIADVARLAGVSVPTVSRVLTGTTNVTKERKDRVLAAIAELGYRPSGIARALVSGKPAMLAVITGDTSRYGYASAIRGIEEEARSAGYTVVITVVDSPNDEIIDAAVTLTLGQPVAGVIVLKFDKPGVAALQRIPKGVPVVAVSGTRERTVSQAVLDETAAARTAVTYLLELGHRTVHHVAVPPSRREEGRTHGWRTALKAAGAPVPDLIQATWEPRSGYEIGVELATRADVTAVFCGNDEIAMGLMRGLQTHGRSVPDDISVVGFDDNPLAEMWLPALTTVAQDFLALGRDAVGLLMKQLEGDESPRFSRRTPVLQIRESSAPPR